MKTSLWRVTAVAVGMAVLGAALFPVTAQEALEPATPAAPAEEPPAAPEEPESEPEAEPAEGLTPQEVAAPAVPSRTAGVVKASNVNVRGRANLQSEVLFQLQQGDVVNILDEVPVADGKEGEPDKWLRIALPPTAPAWVHRNYVDTTTGIVQADVLNVRGGPSEAHSVVGQLKQGAGVVPLETKGDWMRIQPPPGSAAYVAAFLVSTDPAQLPDTVDVASTPPDVTPPTEPPPAEPPPIEVIPPTEPGEVAETPEIEVVTIVEPEPPEVETIEIIEPDVVVVEEPMPEEEDSLPEPPPTRSVRREGIVMRTLSIQAPTSFNLHALHNKKVINYLHAPSSNIVLLDFYGKRVVVSGEEVLDERWMNTPVLNVESIEPVPDGQ